MKDIINWLITQYQTYKDDIIIGLLLSSFIAITLGIQQYTWFITLWAIIVIQIIVRIIKQVRKKKIPAINWTAIIICLITGIYVSVLYLI